MIEEGLLLINKEKGRTSFHVTQAIRRFTKFKKVGHLGTLDPQAEGLLPILLGRTTKLVPFLIKLEKEYEGTMVLGEERDTMDGEGNTISTAPVKEISKMEVNKTFESFIGYIQQVPPKYSAIKINGKASYKWASKGIDKQLPSRKVYVKDITPTKISGNEISFNIVCSRGVYVRSIVSDFGKKLGVGAYLSALTRKRVGGYLLEEALTLEEVKELIKSSNINKHILDFDRALDFLPEITVRDEYVEMIYNGASFQPFFSDDVVDFPQGTKVTLKNRNGNLLGIVSWTGNDSSRKTDKDSCCEYIRVFPPQDNTGL
ncbi:tRNA pseudouridine(55) synthase TruB [bacterium]|nr:tRNA pseudouridine(55) synthase TruB [bacterium]